MDALAGRTTATLARSDDLKVVSWHADIVREAVRPLMRRSFTRRVAVWAYELFAARPPLPADLGTRAPREYVHLDATRFVPAHADGFAGGGAQPDLLRDTETDELYMFKAEGSAYLTFETQAIDALTQPLRARAASLVAAALGVPTPPVTLVEYGTRRGSLQKIVPDTMDLSKLSHRDKRRFKALVHSEKFAMQRSDIWILDRVIGNMDRQSHNMLVESTDGVDALIAIDQDLTFPPVRNVRPIPGVREYTPRRVRRETYARLQQFAADPSILNTMLGPLLTAPELAAVFERVSDTLAVIDNTVRLRGEQAAYF